MIGLTDKHLDEIREQTEKERIHAENELKRLLGDKDVKVEAKTNQYHVEITFIFAKIDINLYKQVKRILVTNSTFEKCLINTLSPINGKLEINTRSSFTNAADLLPDHWDVNFWESKEELR